MTNRVTLPAGRYLIGDLCYQGEIWEEICGRDHGVTEDGRHFACMFTKWGDGEYPDQDGRGFMVDSGTIGVIQYDGPSTSDSMGRSYVFPEPFEVYSEDGLLVFGEVRIQTGPLEEGRDWGMEWYDTSMELE